MLAVALVHHIAAQRDFEGTEERGRENHEHEEENDIRQPVCGQPVEDVGRNAVATHEPSHQDDDGDRQGVEQHDEKEIHKGLETTLCLGFTLTVHEERHGHRNHGEHARRQNGGEAPKDSFENHTPDVGLLASSGFGLSGLNYSGFAVGKVNVLGQGDTLTVFASLIVDFARDGEATVLQFAEGLGKRSRASKLFVLHFKDVVVIHRHIRKVAGLAHSLKKLRSLDVEHRG